MNITVSLLFGNILLPNSISTNITTYIHHIYNIIITTDVCEEKKSLYAPINAVSRFQNTVDPRYLDFGYLG